MFKTILVNLHPFIFKLETHTQWRDR